MCRICETQSNLIHFPTQNDQNYVEQYLACANVTVSQQQQQKCNP